MIERTPQEIADFTGCYVAQDEGGSWFLYTRRPVIDEECACWDYCNPCEVLNITSFVECEPDHDWTKLYEPKAKDSDIKTEPSCPDSADSDIKDSAPHQSQVHVHQEYIVAESKRAEDLAKKVNVMLDHGWKPQGGIAIEYLPESDGYAEGSEIFYQAMTRGIA